MSWVATNCLAGHAWFKRSFLNLFYFRKWNEWWRCCTLARERPQHAEEDLVDRWRAFYSNGHGYFSTRRQFPFVGVGEIMASRATEVQSNHNYRRNCNQQQRAETTQPELRRKWNEEIVPSEAANGRLPDEDVIPVGSIHPVGLFENKIYRVFM